MCWGFDNLPADLEETWLGYVSVSVWANVVVKLRGARYFSELLASLGQYENSVVVQSDTGVMF